MKVCLDVDYRESGAVAAAVLFHEWADDAPTAEHVERIATVVEYLPGQFYKRELPCLLAVLANVPAPELVIVDGYVWLGEERPGLGAHLYEALGRTVPVVGVAKTRFQGAKFAEPVVRGESSTKPLFVTAVGIDAEQAAALVRSMHGPHRLPTLLKRVDTLCREG